MLGSDWGALLQKSWKLSFVQTFQIYDATVSDKLSTVHQVLESIMANTVLAIGMMKKFTLTW